MSRLDVAIAVTTSMRILIWNSSIFLTARRSGYAVPYAEHCFMNQIGSAVWTMSTWKKHWVGEKTRTMRDLGAPADYGRAGNRHLSPTSKADFLSGILAGEIAARVEDDGIVIGADAYRAFIAGATGGRSDGTLSLSEAAAKLRCDRGAINGLVELGLLVGVTTPTGSRVTETIGHRLREGIPCSRRTR